MLETHKHARLEDHLMSTAGECYRLSRAEMAESILRIVLCNHHDETVWTDRVRQLMHEHGRQGEAEKLIRSVKGELEEIHHRSRELLSRGCREKAVRLLNETVDLYPGNRSLILLSAAAMIDFMREQGVVPGYLFRCRHSLLNLLDRDQSDAAADRCLAQLARLGG